MTNLAAIPLQVRWAMRPGRVLLWVLLIMFLCSCVFDPADRILALKVPLFAALVGLTIAGIGTGAVAASVPQALLGYVILFVLVPAASIAVYLLTDGRMPFEGFSLAKGYVLIGLALVLYINRIDLIGALSFVLLILAVLVLLLVIALSFVPGLYEVLYFPGVASGLLYLDRRDYGSGIVLLQAYFVTTPMLVVPIAHYFDKARRCAPGWRRVSALVATGLCMAGMFLAGTRNNMAVSILLPLALVFVYSRSKVLGAILASVCAVLVAAAFQDQIAALLSPTEYANNLKISLLQDYGTLLNSPRPLLVGYGLGAYEYWAAKAQYYFVSELTYLEMIRNFGLPGAMIMLSLLVFPILRLWWLERGKHLAVAFGLYLVMCASNPNLFSSMGILILSVLVARAFTGEREAVVSPSLA